MKTEGINYDSPSILNNYVSILRLPCNNNKIILDEAFNLSSMQRRDECYIVFILNFIIKFTLEEERESMS